MYVDRTYRSEIASELRSFDIKIKETDLLISLSAKDFSPEIKDMTRQYIFSLRNQLENYIKEDPDFFSSIDPYLISKDAPIIVKEMTRCSNMAGVGPMAAVAGAFAELVGRFIGTFSREVIVENGGDIYLKSKKVRQVGIFAGKSPFSNQIGLRILPQKTPLGICTSSGTVGPSLSFGRADAVVILAKSAFLADAVATATGNIINTPEDFEEGINFAQKIEGVQGIVLIKDDRMSIWGSVEIVPLIDRS